MDRPRLRPLPLAAASLALVGLLSGCGVSGAESSGTESGAAATSGDVFMLTVGDCLDDADAAVEVTSVPIVDCAEPHDSEVFARTEVAGDAFPGADALDAELLAFCRGDAFTSFVGIPHADSVYATGGYYPTAASWARGDRELLCTIRADDGPVTGSLAGVAR